MTFLHAADQAFRAKRLPYGERRFALGILRKSLTGLVAAMALISLTSCYRSGAPVMGVAESNTWFSLPLEDFLHEGDSAPVAMSFCAADTCPAKLAVGVLTMTGETARQLERILEQSEILKSELDFRSRKPTLKRAIAKGSKQHIATTLQITPLKSDPAKGFSLQMSRKDGKGRITATVLGWRNGEALKVVIAIGSDEAATQAAASSAVNHYPN